MQKLMQVLNNRKLGTNDFFKSYICTFAAFYHLKVFFAYLTILATAVSSIIFTKPTLQKKPTPISRHPPNSHLIDVSTS